MASNPLWRGSRLAYGSWKTIWISLPRRLRSACDVDGRERSWPQAWIVPDVGVTRPMIILAIVVLPDPDSPTMASEPPAAISNETSSTTSPIAVPFRQANHLEELDPRATTASVPRSSSARTHRTSPSSSRSIVGRFSEHSGCACAQRSANAQPQRRFERRSGPARNGVEPSGHAVDVGTGGDETGGIRVQRVVVQQR